MPITPFHFGPGVFVKSVLCRHFSLPIFILAQVTTDMESAWNMIQQHQNIHTFFHTFLGAAVMALGLGGFCRLFFYFKKQTPPWRMLLVSSFIGTFSHVFLDAIMHRDVHPFAPLSGANPFLRICSLGVLHWGCLGFGLVGGCIWIWNKQR